MVIFVLLISNVLGKLIVWSETSTSKQELEYVLYPSGKVLPYSTYSLIKNFSCFPLSQNSYENIAFLLDLKNCQLNNFAITLEAASPKFVILPLKDHLNQEFSKIIQSYKFSFPIIGVGQRHIDLLEKLIPESLFGTFEMDFLTVDLPFITLVMSSSFESNKEYLFYMKELMNDFHEVTKSFALSIATYNQRNLDFDKKSICEVLEFGEICETSSDETPAEEKIKYLSSIEKDYRENNEGFVGRSLEMHEKNEEIIEGKLDIAIEKKRNVEFLFKTSDIALIQMDHPKTFALINNIEIWNGQDLAVAYCMSMANPTENCPKCSDLCTWEFFRSDQCYEECNNEQCGFQNMKCLKITPANPNEKPKSNDNYNINSSHFSQKARQISDDEEDICNTGCYYSDMEIGLCFSACTGNCFNYCSSQYCSPGCSYNDLNNEYCPSQCSKKCIKNHGTCKSQVSSSEETMIYVYSVIPICIVVLLIPCLYVLRHKIRDKCCPHPLQENPELGQNAENNQRRQKDKVKIEKIKLLIVDYSKDLNFLGENICSIDLEEFEEGHKIIVTPCQHGFHPVCLQEWFKAKNHRGRCPNCLYSLKGYAIEIPESDNK